jgi:hypothetical protein
MSEPEAVVQAPYIARCLRLTHRCGFAERHETYEAARAAADVHQELTLHAVAVGTVYLRPAR